MIIDQLVGHKMPSLMKRLKMLPDFKGFTKNWDFVNIKAGKQLKQPCGIAPMLLWSEWVGIP